MKRNFYLFFTAIITLIVFTYTSCVNQLLSALPEEADVYQIEIGKGNPYYVYLDSNYNIIENPIGINDPDPGKTAILVDENQLAEGVMALAETTQNGTTVRLINKNNNSTIYMFFEQGNNFPSSFIIETQGERSNAFLSNYDTQREQYSITFEQNGEFFTHDGIIMSKSIFTIYDNDPTLTTAQNTRIRNIYTALGVYASLFNVFSDENNTKYFASWWSENKPYVVGIFIGIAIVAFCVSLIFMAPIAIGSVAVLLPGLGSIPSFISLGISLVAGVIAMIIEGIHDDEKEPEMEKIVVTIQKDGERIPKGKVFYVAPNSHIDFQINIKLPSSNDKVYYGLYDPFLNSWYPAAYNYVFFTAKAISNNTSEMNLPFNSSVSVTEEPLPLPPTSFTLRISRNNYTGTGTNGGGFDFVLIATKPMVVNNDNNNYFEIYDAESDKKVKTPNVYVIHLTIN